LQTLESQHRRGRQLLGILKLGMLDRQRQGDVLVGTLRSDQAAAHRGAFGAVELGAEPVQELRLQLAQATHRPASIVETDQCRDAVELAGQRIGMTFAQHRTAAELEGLLIERLGLAIAPLARA
jgi:hypothetical protein